MFMSLCLSVYLNDQSQIESIKKRYGTTVYTVHRVAENFQVVSQLNAKLCRIITFTTETYSLRRQDTFYTSSSNELWGGQNNETVYQIYSF